jgi:glycosyltransferase involved in cell wall biosynthesis
MSEVVESSRPESRWLGSVVVPAHDEQANIARLLEKICRPVHGGRFEVIVVCNGCTDRTEEIARRFPVRVEVIAEPSKRAALHRGDVVAQAFPRVYLDADVVITADDLALVVAALNGPVHAAGPRRVVPRDGMPWIVRWYYDMWESLPQVRTDLFGRGMIAVSRTGHERIRELPPAMSDDLAFSEVFMPAERLVVTDAVCIVRGPRTVRDLIRRRTRVFTGNVEADREGLRGAQARTGAGGLVRTVRMDPGLALKLPVFLSVTALARWRARRALRAGDFTTWERDESSRT